ncbi:MAG: hypothetical protein J2P13_04295 [Acidobacteria bacterium]|nr:hypothetical protein [Acidobacteriota bacterium]
MNAFSPTAEGFRLILRRPAIPFAEVVWRWTFAAAFWVLSSALLLQYAGTLPVNRTDRLLFGTGQPALVLRALERIFHGSALRFTVTSILLSLALAIAWIVLASIGRAVTLRAMAEEFGMPPSARKGLDSIRSLIGLHFLRASTALAALVAGAGAALVLSELWARTRLSAADAGRLWLGWLLLVWIAWGVVNWVLSTAPVFVIADGARSLESISSTVRWCRREFASVAAVGFWFGLAHGGAFFAVWGATLTVLGMAAALGPWLTLLPGVAVLAGYSVVADFLFSGRLAAYLATLHPERTSAFAPEQPPVAGPEPGASAVDQTELILSDTPLAAT